MSVAITQNLGGMFIGQCFFLKIMPRRQSGPAAAATSTPEPKVTRGRDPQQQNGSQAKCIRPLGTLVVACALGFTLEFLSCVFVSPAVVSLMNEPLGATTFACTNRTLM
jgi:hypothetical protein